MNRWILPAALALASLLLLSGCATDDDDPFPVHPSAAATSDAPPIPGAATPAPNSSSSGWDW